MTDVKILKRSRLLVALLAVITSICLVFGGISMVSADSALDTAKQTAVSEIEAYYVANLVNVGVVAGEEQMAYYKDKAESKINGATQETDVEGYKTQALEEMGVIVYVAQMADDVLTAFASYDKGSYREFRYNHIVIYKDDAVKALQVANLISAGKLNKTDATAIRDQALADMASVKPNVTAEENIGEVKKEMKDHLQWHIDQNKATGLYDQEGQQQLDDLFVDFSAQLDTIDNADQAEGVHAHFVSELENVMTIVEKNWMVIIEDETFDKDQYPDRQPLSTQEILALCKEAVEKFNASGSDDFKLQGIVEELLNRYKAAKIKELDGLYDKTKYSAGNIAKINEKKAEAVEKIRNATEFSTMESAKSTFVSDVEKVAVNVNTVSTSAGAKYQVTITSTNQYAFDPDTKIEVKDYTFSAARKNVNRILYKDYNGIRVIYYININIKNPDGTLMTEFDGQQVFTVSIGLDKLDKLQTYGEELKVVYYAGDGKLEDFDHEAQIDEENGVLTFKAKHFSPYAICGKNTQEKGLAALLTRMGFRDGNFFFNPFLYLTLLLVVVFLWVVIAIIRKTTVYRLTFYTMGGSKLRPAKAHKGEYWLTPPVPTKDGYVFGGWYTDKEYKNRFTDLMCTKRKNLKVYAKWVVKDAYIASLPDYFAALKATMLTYEQPETMILEANRDVVHMLLNPTNLCLYFNADPKVVKATKIKSVVAIDKKKEDVPYGFKYLVYSDKTFREALTLVNAVMEAEQLKKVAHDEEEYVIVTDEERAVGYTYTLRSETAVERLNRMYRELRRLVKSYKVGDLNIAKMIDGNYLTKLIKKDDKIFVYLALYAKDFAGLLDAGQDKNFAGVSAYTIVETERSFELAKQYITEVMHKFGMVYERVAEDDVQGDNETGYAYKVVVEYGDDDDQGSDPSGENPEDPASKEESTEEAPEETKEEITEDTAPIAAPVQEKAPEEQPAEEPVQEEAPVEEPVEEPAQEEAPVEQPEEEPVQEEAPVEQPAEEPAQEEAPVEQPEEEPVQEEAPAEEPAEEPVQEEAPAEEPAEEPVQEETPAEEPAEEPVQEEAPVEQPEEEPAQEEAPVEEPVEEPVQEEAPVEEPAEEPVQEEAPAEEPVEEPVQEEAPAEEPVEEPAQEEAPVEEPEETFEEEPIDEDDDEYEEVEIEDENGQMVVVRRRKKLRKKSKALLRKKKMAKMSQQG